METGGVRFGTRESDLEEHAITYGNIVNRSLTVGGVDRLTALQSLDIGDPIRYAGLPGYKQILLWKKYKPFIPQEYASDPLYAKPTKEVIDSEKKDQKKRSAVKKERKETKIARTAASNDAPSAETGLAEDI